MEKRHTIWPLLFLLKIYIWEAQIFFDNPHLGIPWHYSRREISGLGVRWAWGEKWSFLGKNAHNFSGRGRSASHSSAIVRKLNITSKVWYFHIIFETLRNFVIVTMGPVFEISYISETKSIFSGEKSDQTKFSNRYSKST